MAAMKKLHIRFGQDRGMTLIFVGLSMLAFMSATMLALDVGNLMVARTQAQSSADSGALAGATALIFDDFNDRSATGPAVRNAIAASTSSQNRVVNVNVSVIPADVTFPAIDKVRVTVNRTSARGNPVATFLGPMIGINTVNVGAVATAQASPANAETCVKPFMIPDRWRENQNPPWDPSSSTFDIVDNKGKPLANPDVYVPADQPGYTGYDMYRDRGVELMIRAGTGNNISPSMYYSWKMPGGTGGNFYRDNISGCNTAIMHWGDLMIQEPGNMVGPTDQGIDDLIAKDPNAYWDTSCNCVKGSAYGGSSPRISPIPLYDPMYYATGKQNGRTADFKMANWIGFFIERRVGNNVYARITPILGINDGGGGPAPAGSFPKVLRLVG
jgi:hypothetical protein